MEMERTNYQTSFERHYTALLGMFRYLITQFADESVEIAARAVALAAPLPNAINMYNVAVAELGWNPFASFAFSLTLEIVVFLLVEVALRQWDGYLDNPRRYRNTLGISIGVVGVAVIVVMVIVYTLETYKIMALLPVVSLCSFVGIGLKRWDERNQDNGVQSVDVSPVKRRVKNAVKHDTIDSENITPEIDSAVSAKVDSRRKMLLDMLGEIDGHPIDALNKSAIAKRLSVSRPTVIADIAALQSTGDLTLNGHVKVGKSSQV